MIGIFFLATNDHANMQAHQDCYTIQYNDSYIVTVTCIGAVDLSTEVPKKH